MDDFSLFFDWINATVYFYDNEESFYKGEANHSEENISVKCLFVKDRTGVNKFFSNKMYVAILLFERSNKPKSNGCNYIKISDGHKFCRFEIKHIGTFVQDYIFVCEGDIEFFSCKTHGYLVEDENLKKEIDGL